MATTWKFLYDSVTGTSHAVDGSECQDSSFATPYGPAGAEGTFIAICSDGAGSARESKAGSSLACRVLAEQITTFLDAGGDVAFLTNESILGWFLAVHTQLLAEAERLATTPRELACTLIMAVLGSVSRTFRGSCTLDSNAENRDLFAAQLVI